MQPVLVLLMAEDGSFSWQFVGAAKHQNLVAALEFMKVAMVEAWAKAMHAQQQASIQQADASVLEMLKRRQGR